MEDEKKPATVGEQIAASLGNQAVMDHLLVARGSGVSSPGSSRKKRRRKGQLNDGQWAPGYGPDAKKKKKP